MSQSLALPTFREQDFQAPQSRTVGAGVEGLEEITDLERSERLRRMREGTLGSIHSWELVTAVDGPGTRMTVFLNGCPLRCLYCHNPDTFLMKDGAPVSDTELLSRIARYRRIFRTTNGGITLSGGEVLMQPQFAKRILMGAKEMGVHTCIDTSGFLGANCDDEMLDAIDLVLLDVKSGNEETYKKTTGRSLAPTIEFGDRIAARGGATRMWIGGRTSSIVLRFSPSTSWARTSGTRWAWNTTWRTRRPPRPRPPRRSATTSVRWASWSTDAFVPGPREKAA